MTYHTDPVRIRELIEQSSLGTPAARAARSSVPAATGRWVVQQLAERRHRRPQSPPAR